MRTIITALSVLLFTTVAMGQNTSGSPKDGLFRLRDTMPSSQELSELLAKAEEKVSQFEVAVRNAKPFLDAVNPQLASNYQGAASTAHLLIRTANKNGPSGYQLVALLTTLDDLSLDAANGSVQLLAAEQQRIAKGSAPDMAAEGAVVGLTTVESSCNDISELLMHATLRYIDVEEKILIKLLPDTKS